MRCAPRGLGVDEGDDEAGSGAYRAFERCLTRVAAGVRLIAPCDQDDVWHPDKLAVLAGALERSGALLAYCDLRVVRPDGTVCLVGAPPKPLAVTSFSLIFGRKRLAGSLIGGIAGTQEMLDFCGQHGITADVEIIPIQKINEAYERMLRSDVKYRFSIDMASLKGE